MERSPADSAILLSGIEFAWPGAAPILSIGHFEVARGERVFLRGPSGSGKSTLLGLIGGVLVSRTGTARVLGRDLRELSAGARD
ncbi:MAG: ATP-binding cassette domain-containing protein, partial [Steroidobacteraceae bacterium]